MANTEKWYYAYVIMDDMIAVMDVCHAQNIVAERNDEGSVFHRLDAIKLDSWRDNYSLGELWRKNVLGGRP